MTVETKKMSKKGWLYAFLLVVFVVGVAFFIYWYLILRGFRYTDDCYVEGNKVSITPLREGIVEGIYSDDSFLVDEGQLLIQINEDDSKIAFETAQDNLAAVVREVSGLYHDAFLNAANVQIAEAEYIKAMQDYEHRRWVVNEGGVSLEDFEHSTAALRASSSFLQGAEQNFLKARAMVQGTSLFTHPFVLQAADKLVDALIQLNRCRLYSPVKGLVAQRTVQVGSYVLKGEPLLSVIPLDQIWVNANYKETAMKDMRIGQQVRITSDLYGKDVVYNGRIVGLPGGAGNAFSLLPPQNLSGNWIKIVQRLPVRVKLDPEEFIKYPLRLGLSMHSRVDCRDTDLPFVPTLTDLSPTYSTDILSTEEQGADQLIEEIIWKNADQSLSSYFTNPLNLNDWK